VRHHRVRAVGVGVGIDRRHGCCCSAPPAAAANETGWEETRRDGGEGLVRAGWAFGGSCWSGRGPTRPFELSLPLRRSSALPP
jgi:hypothetical protein